MLNIRTCTEATLIELSRLIRDTERNVAARMAAAQLGELFIGATTMAKITPADERISTAMEELSAIIGDVAKLRTKMKLGKSRLVTGWSSELSSIEKRLIDTNIMLEEGW